HRVGRNHRLELLAPLRRWLDLKAGTEQRLELRSRLAQRAPRLERQIDTIERPAPAEHFLRRVDIHYGQIAAERAGETAGAHDAAHDEASLAIGCAERQLAVNGEAVAPGKSPRHHDRVRLGQKN